MRVDRVSGFHRVDWLAVLVWCLIGIGSIMFWGGVAGVLAWLRK